MVEPTTDDGTGKEADLTLKEYALLVYLTAQRGRSIGRATLLHQLWGYDESADSSTIETHIRRLRARIEDHPGAPALLETVRGFGYRLADQSESA
jgi:two-component system response regulator RegX3